MDRFGSVHLSGVGHGDLDRHFVTAPERHGRRFQIAVFERGVAEPVAEPVQRRTGNVLILALMQMRGALAGGYNK